MKKVIIALIIALTAGMDMQAGTPARISHLVRQYKGQDGFDVVSIGPVGMKLLKGAAHLSKDLDAEDKAALKSFSGIKKLVIVDYEDASPSVKAQFNKKVEKILNGMELLMEAKDDDGTVSIYGVEDGDRLKDCVLHCHDGDLIFIKGSIDWSQLGDLKELK
ncbi:MAG: DUF4252 domain-containing protein [Bacteroidales bacterium]|nr:DUF4252 domain-containing protein [Bacteroidales bacterium]MBR1783443.1 DUF4252 domain-containing protein [Bacteroidales bacterium]